MRYIFISWKHGEYNHKIAHDLGDEYTAVEVARWMRGQLNDERYPSFVFYEITKEQYDYYDKRKLTTRNFE